MLLRTAVLYLCCVFFHVEAVQLTIAYENKAQPPYYMGNNDSVPKLEPGITVEMIQMLEQLIPGLEIKLLRRPWPRCLKELGANSVDGIFNASYKAERLQAGWYPTSDGTHSGPLDTSRRTITIAYSLYTLKDSSLSWDGQNFTNLKNSKIAAPLGYSIVGDLENKGIAVKKSLSTRMTFEMLVRRRVAGIVVQEVTGDAILQAYPEDYQQVVKVTPVVAVKPYYLMLSHGFVHKHPQLAQQIWDTLRVIRETQFYEIALKYLPR
ncbi:substrate-binding periplasmic protein [Psychromonas aquimarina]|uniref:substrate-binding periplasmic protein n=1 Tax=Psychromonas aquimarina TaxID=444919 RepID=UPI000421A33B|nr:transporter substrate-binding domain-containing protein [Psychromonas aquimarina]